MSSSDAVNPILHLLHTAHPLLLLQCAATQNQMDPALVQQQLLNLSLQQLLLSSMSSMRPVEEVASAVEELMEEDTHHTHTTHEHKEAATLSVPNDDKEGWCRNKKYIEKTATGFMCLVCKKVYGRYNSVSYHVTIYHRNPPIKCDVEGCDFTTREARYIHFHKYYRHGVALPRSIDQGSRRCSMCKHVSKSPAMLEKHMKRHLQGWKSRNGEKSRLSSMCESIGESEMGEEGRSRTMSECVPMQVEEMELSHVTKDRSFTL